MKRTLTPHINGWPRDIETGLPILPFGEFAAADGDAEQSRLLSENRNLPVLHGQFDLSRFALDEDLPTHVGWGSIRLGQSTAITIRIQRGPDVLYWLANAADPEVWTALDQWHTAGKLVLCADFANGRSLVLTRDFEVHPGFRAQACLATFGEALTPKFIVEASKVILNDEAKGFATTDLPAFPRLRHVQACMVRTATTGSVALAVDTGGADLGVPMETDVAHVVRNLFDRQRTRH